MATGRMPFAGATSAVVFHAILELDPVAATQLNPTLPPKLQEITEKLLEKDRDLRYQSAADVRSDLRRLKRDVESGKKVTAASSGSATIPVSATTAASGSGSSPVAAAQASSQGSMVVAAAAQHKVGTGLAALLGIVVLLPPGTESTRC